MLKEELKCEFCGISHNDVDLYEGWFRHPHSQNEFFKGTATSGLLVRRIACDDCVKIQTELGLRP